MDLNQTINQLFGAITGTLNFILGHIGEIIILVLIFWLILNWKRIKKKFNELMDKYFPKQAKQLEKLSKSSVSY